MLAKGSVQFASYRLEILNSDMFNNLDNLEAWNATDMRRYIWIVKDAFQILGKVLRNREISLETKKRALNYLELSDLIHGSEFWTISSHIKKRNYATENILDTMATKRARIVGSIKIIAQSWTLPE